jgi:hypothetical protein
MPIDPPEQEVNALTSDVPLRPGEPLEQIPLVSENRLNEPERPWNAYLSKGLIVLTLLSAIALTFYIFVTYRVLFHSDAATKNLLADEIIRTRQFFPSNWYYVNDIWILTPHLVIVALALLLPNSFLLHAIACFIFALLFAGSLYALCKTSGLRMNDFLFAISLLFTGLSPWFAENLFGQFGYGTGVAATFLLIALVFRVVRAYNEGDRRNRWLWSTLLIIFLSILVAGGVRGVFVYAIPVVATLAIVVLVPEAGQVRRVFHRRAALYVVLLVVIAIFLGVASFLAIRSGIQLHNDKSAAQYVDYPQLKSNIGIFFEGFLAFAGAMPEANKRPLSVYGLITAYRLFWFSVALLLPFSLLFRYRLIANPHFRFLLIYYAFSLLATLYLYLFSSLPQNAATFRYCLNPCILAIVLIGYALEELRQRYGTKIVCFVVTACLPIYASSYQALIAPYFEANVSPLFDANSQLGSRRHSNPHENVRQPLADYLASQGLRYGYATYWNAGVLTVLSGERTHVRAISLDGPPIPFRWLAAAHSYASDGFHGRTFLLLTDQEYLDLNKAFLETYLGPPESVRALPGYRIMVYGFNVAARLPEWEERPKPGLDEKYLPIDLKAELECKVSAVIMDSGQPAVLQVEVTNLGGKPFASYGQYPINLGAHLYTRDLQLTNYDYLRVRLPHPLKAGESSALLVPLTTLPPGEYVLQVAMVQEGVGWFGEKKGGQPLQIKLRVRQTDETRSLH